MQLVTPSAVQIGTPRFGLTGDALSSLSKFSPEAFGRKVATIRIPLVCLGCLGDRFRMVIKSYLWHPRE
jgi:hypothetical protein